MIKQLKLTFLAKKLLNSMVDLKRRRKNKAKDLISFTSKQLETNEPVVKRVTSKQ